MRLIDHFDEALVLHDAAAGAAGADRANALCAALRAQGVDTWRVDLGAADPWQAWPGRHGGEAAAGRHGPSVLLLDGDLTGADRFCGTQDGLVEQLECGEHPWVVLAHADGGLGSRRSRVSRLLPTDGVPSHPLAVAVGRRLLRGILDLLPDRGCAGAFTAEDWLTLATCMAPAVQPGLRRALAWPSITTLTPLSGPGVKPAMC